MVPFTQITSGTNINQTLTVGNASVLTYGGSGQLKASQIADSTGAIAVLPIAVAGAQDYVTATNGAPGAPGLVQIGAAGTDTNINLRLTTKGTGILQLGSPSAFVDSGGNLTVTACSGCSAGAGLPAVDTTALVKNVTDNTKQVRLSAANLSTATTTTLSAQNASYTLAGLETNQTFTGNDIFTKNLLVGLTSTDAFTAVGDIGSAHYVGSQSATTNASTVFMGPDVANSRTFLSSGSSGTGTVLPLAFIIGGSEVSRFPAPSSSDAGSLFIGLTSLDQAFTKGVIANGGFLVASAATAASTGSLTVSPGSAVTLSSSHTATGTDLPLTFFEGNAEVGRFAAPGTINQGALLVGLTSSDANFSNGVISRNGFLTASATGNATIGFLAMLPTSVNIGETHTGTGPDLPVTFTEGGVEVARFPLPTSTNDAGAFLVGLTSTDQTGSFQHGVISLGGFMTASAATNANLGFLYINPGVNVGLGSAHSGTASDLPLAFGIGNIEAARFTTARAFLEGATSSDAFIAPGDIGSAHYVGAQSATVNASTVFLGPDVGNGRTFLSSGSSGTGTVLPLAFIIGGTERMRINPAGTIFSGMTSSDITAGIAAYFTTNGGFLAMSGPTNATYLSMNNNGTSSQFNSSHTGTGTTGPMVWMMDAVAKMVLTTTGVLLQGTTSSDAFIAAGDIGSSHYIGSQSAATNASTVFLGLDAGRTFLSSGHSGTGTTLPLVFIMGNTEVARILTNGHVIINGTTDDGTGAFLQVHGSISVNGTILTVP